MKLVSIIIFASSLAWPHCTAVSNDDSPSANLHNTLQAHVHDPKAFSDHANQLFSQANTFFGSGDFKQALAVYNLLLSYLPDSYALSHNAGKTYYELNQPEQAITCYQKAITLRPTSPALYLDYATACLAAGDYKNGWSAYEWRWQLPEKQAIRNRYPLWEGCPIGGKTILLHCEGSLGDALQFVRYAQLVKKLDVTIIVRTLSPLKPLLSCCPYIDHVISDNDPLQPVDVHTSLMSLPHIFTTTVDTIPVKIPYLFPDETLVSNWQNKLKHDRNFKIGICWQADPQNDAQRPAIAQRSVPLALFEQLTQLPNSSLYSLQKISGLEQIDDKRMQWLINYCDDTFDTNHGRFMDTAALIQNLDLIISVDTSIAHLAGALGKPTWVILPWKSDWRWLINRDDCPWYPTVRLFRKQQDDDWQAVIKEIVTMLKEYIKEYRV